MFGLRSVIYDFRLTVTLTSGFISRKGDMSCRHSQENMVSNTMGVTETVYRGNLDTGSIVSENAKNEECCANL